MDPVVAVAAACFEQQDAGLRIGRQPVCQHASGRTCADDDEVVTARINRGFIPMPVHAATPGATASTAVNRRHSGAMASAISR